MEKSRQVLIGFALAFILIAGGFASGYYFNLHKAASPTTSAPVSQTPAPSTAAAPLTNNPTMYQASPPSKGRAYRTVTLSLENIANRTATVYLPNDQAKDIAAGQPVLLYDKDNLLLTIPGTVKSVTHGTEGPFARITTVAIDIADTPDIPVTRVATGEVVVEKFSLADRLPLTALQKESDGTPYIWEAVRQSDGAVKAIKRTPAQAIILNPSFFIVSNSDYISNIYLLNPDPSLQDGQTISVQRTLYQAPDVPNPDEIAMIRDDVIADYRHHIKEIPFWNGTRSGGSGGCPASATITQDFINKVKTMAKTRQ